jgi:pimeloyl-ACP methyl ester carboxylesterase
MGPVVRMFDHAGNRLVFDERGVGDRVIVLLPGMTMSRVMYAPLATRLAQAGYRVVCLDPLGHGESARPTDMGQYSVPLFARQVLALLDELGIESAVIGGASLGANVAIETAAVAPSRVRGVVVEMPVLDNGVAMCAAVFTPMLLSLTFGAPLLRMAGVVARHAPRRTSLLTDVALDIFSQDPAPSAAVIKGVFFGRVAPSREERQHISQPVLVIGHRRDPLHPMSDADMLAAELPQGQLLEARSLVELRTKPERLTGEIVNFLAGCFVSPADVREGDRSAPRIAKRPR